MVLIRRVSFVFAALLAATGATGADYYVSLTGDDANDGSAEHPFRTPCYALSKAARADTVHFAPGVYALTNTPQILQNFVTLKGEGATRDDVVFDAGGKFRCLDIGFPDSGSNRQNYYRYGTTLSGITFKNGYLAQTTGGYNNWGYDFGAGVRLANVYGNTGTADDHSTITNCAFVACTNLCSYGGALNAAGGATIVDCLFKDNYAGPGNGNGGEPGGAALHLQPAAADVTICDCTFENNVASNGFSVIAAGSWQGTLDQNEHFIRLSDCTFRGNVSLNATASAQQYPMLGRKVREAFRCTFESNRAKKCATGDANGTVMYLGTSAWTNRFDTCTFEGNSADGKGGCFYLSGVCHPVFTNCTFRGNVSAGAGAAIFCTRVGTADNSDVPLTVEGCRFIGNRTTCATASNCGGIVTAGVGSRILRSSFTANETYGWCGVIESMANTDLVIDACSFTANVIRPQTSGTVSSHSGFLLIGGVTGQTEAMPDVRNCLFACNTNLETNTKGHAVFLRGYYSRVHNCTFVGNRSAEPDADGYGIFVFGAGGYEVRNCLFADNHVIGSNAPNNGFGRSEYVRNSAEDGDSLNVNTEWGKNIRNATMYFTDAAKGDYRPTKKTPGRDRGLTFDWMAGTKDLSGEVDRIVNEIPDFGCYEWIRIPRGLALIFR